MENYGFMTVRVHVYESPRLIVLGIEGAWKMLHTFLGQ